MNLPSTIRTLIGGTISTSGAALVFPNTLLSGVAVRRRIGRRNVGLDICGDDDGEPDCCWPATMVISLLSVLTTNGGSTGSLVIAGTVVSITPGVVGIPIDKLDDGRGAASSADSSSATLCNEENVGLSDGTRDIDVLRLDGGSTSCPLSLSIGGPNADFFGVLERGLKKMPAGCPGGLEMSRPEDGVDPSCTASSEKYSVLFDMPSGEGGASPAFARSSISFAPLLERSELLRALGGRLPAGDRFDGWPVYPKNEDAGVAGEVAMGEKKGSTGGRIKAMCNCVSTLCGPAGLGTIMTSGTGPDVPR